MESTAAQVRDLVSKIGDAVETKLKIWKLKAVGKGAEVVSSVVSLIAIIILGGIALLLLGMGLAYLVGYWLGAIYYGFLVVAGIYGLAGFLIFHFRKKIIKGPVSDQIIDSILN